MPQAQGQSSGSDEMVPMGMGGTPRGVGLLSEIAVHIFVLSATPGLCLVLGPGFFIEVRHAYNTRIQGRTC